MGFFSKKSSTLPSDSTSATNHFATWVEPPKPDLTTPEQHRLYGYARKVACELAQAQVPLFRNDYPRSGAATFRDAFWFVAVAPQWAKYWGVLHVLVQAEQQPGYPPPAKERERQGHFRGKGLLLTRAGLPVTCRLEGWVDRHNDVVNSRSGDILFHDLNASADSVMYEDWGWHDHGRWRDAREKPTTLYGLHVHTRALEYQENWRNTSRTRQDDERSGKGTSAALNRFLRGSGQLQGPRGFFD